MHCNTKSEIAVPIKIDDRIIGVFNIESKEVNAYDHHDLALITAFASQSAISIERAKLHEQVVKSQKIEQQLQDDCQKIIDMINLRVLKSECSDEAKAFFVKMVGDYYRYIAENEVPYNKLYDYVSPYGEKYNVIGCTMCHIPVREGFDPRLGKFPWEQSKKECGLHDHGGGI